MKGPKKAWSTKPTLEKHLSQEVSIYGGSGRWGNVPADLSAIKILFHIKLVSHKIYFLMNVLIFVTFK